RSQNPALCRKGLARPGPSAQWADRLGVARPGYRHHAPARGGVREPPHLRRPGVLHERLLPALLADRLDRRPGRGEAPSRTAAAPRETGRGGSTPRAMGDATARRRGDRRAHSDRRAPLGRKVPWDVLGFLESHFSPAPRSAQRTAGPGSRRLREECLARGRTARAEEGGPPIRSKSGGTPGLSDDY